MKKKWHLESFLVLSVLSLLAGFCIPSFAHAEVLQGDYSYQPTGTGGQAIGVSFASGTISSIGTSTLGFANWTSLKIGSDCTTNTIDNAADPLDMAGCSHEQDLMFSTTTASGLPQFITPTIPIEGLVMIGESHNFGSVYMMGTLASNTSTQLGFCLTSFSPCATTNLNPMPYIEINSTVPPPIYNPMISFVYPTSSTPQPIIPFNGDVFYVSGLDPNSSGYIVNTFRQAFLNSTSSNPLCSVSSPSSLISGVSSAYVVVPDKICYLSQPISASTTLDVVTANLLNLSSVNPLASTTLSWTLLNQLSTSTYNLITVSSSGTVLFNASTNPYATTTLNSFCVPPQSILDVGGGIYYGLCAAVQVIFTPQPFAPATLQKSLTDFEAAPPFGQVFGIFSNLETLASTSPQGTELDYNLNLGMASGSVPFLTSSTLSNAVTPSGKIFLFQIEDAVFYLLDLGLIFFVPWHWWRKKHLKQHTQ